MEGVNPYHTIGPWVLILNGQPNFPPETTQQQTMPEQIQSQYFKRHDPDPMNHKIWHKRRFPPLTERNLVASPW